MTRYHVLISCPLLTETISEYDDRFAEHDISYTVADVDQQLTEDELIDRINQYDGVLIGDDEFTPTVLETADRLKIISKWGIGTDNIDKDAAAENGVAVYNTPGTLSDEVAMVVIGYAIMLTRRLHLIDREIRDGNWYKYCGTSLTGKTMGVIGVGDVGSAVARKAAGLGMDVLGTDIGPLPEGLRQETGIERVDIHELLDQSDVVSLNCALTEETRELIGQTELDLLGPDGYIINTSRGEVIDQAELEVALEEDRIAGAGLDVFETEPLDGDHPFTGFENVILGSHNAQNTTEAIQRVTDLAVDNLIKGLTNKP
jgi:D-3-phosphoglycerate dehydrogenase